MTKKSRVKLGEPIPLDMSQRYYQFNRQYAVRDVFDALVELVTNSDDSYHRLTKHDPNGHDGGQILIEYQEQRKGQPSHLTVRDRAEGMTLKEMMAKLGNVGVRRSEEGDRGFMARGAKDCTELGPMMVESIKNGRYYACSLTPDANITPLSDGGKVDRHLRDRLGITRGNGTQVTLTIDARHKMPRMGTLLRDLPWHFALRDIMSEESTTRVRIRNLNDPDAGLADAVYRRPDGELVIDEEFEVPGYPEARAWLTIWRAPEPFEESGDRRFRQFGLLIKGERAIHECSLMMPEFERDPYAARYFGRIDCPYIDALLNEYDDYREQGLQYPDYNPLLLIDPNRQGGLIRDHPFTQALFQVPTERLRALIAMDREAERRQRDEVANRETKRRLDRLAKVASRFMQEQMEDLEELAAGDDIDPSTFFEQGLMIVPTYLRLALGEEKTLWVYVRKNLVAQDHVQAVVEADGPGLVLLDQVLDLLPHPRKADRLVGTFRIRAGQLSEGVCVQVIIEGLPPAEAIVQIVERRVEERDFEYPLEFEHAEYRVRQGSTRTLRLYALYPDLVSGETLVDVRSEDDRSVAVRGRSQLVPVEDSNYARADVTVEGRRLNARVSVRAFVNGREALASVCVKQKHRSGVPIKIEIRDADYGNYRARWADHEGQPNHLWVSARHKSLRRYLGPPPDFEGQNHPVFRLLLAEIVAESVCRKVLRMEAQHRSWEFNLAGLKNDQAIVDDVLARLHRRIRDFVADAHIAMLSDGELRSLL